MFKPNLAEVPNEAVYFPKYASPKLDGIRACTVNGDTLTRSLKAVPNEYIRSRLKAFQGLDGEVIVGPPHASDVYRVTNSAVMSHKGEPEFTYYVFDDLTNSGVFRDRLASLRAMSLPPFIQVLEQRLIHTQPELDAYYQTLLEAGYEGVILRNPGAKYKHGRSTAKSQDLLKLKPFADDDAVVLRVYEGRHNTNEAFTNELGRTDRSTAAAGLIGNGMLGGFVVEDVKTGVQFDCAPGVLTHAERVAVLQQNPVGKIIKYRHMPYGLMANGKPRFPRFIGWRSKEDM
jgi:DNA ligase-1